MSREEYDPEDARTTRASRRNTQATDRLPPSDPSYGSPVNPNWRGDRAVGRSRRTQALPSSRQEFMLWLQYGGWRIVAIVAAIALLVIVALILLSDPPQPFPTAQATPETAFGQNILSDQPTVTPFAESPTAAPTAPGAVGGAQFRVFNTGAQGLFLRPDPGINNQPIKTLPEGTIVTVIGEDSSGPDYVWKHIRDPEGAEGWAAADFLQPVQ